MKKLIAFAATLAFSTAAFGQVSSYFEAGGDLSGTWNIQKVVGVNGVAVPATLPCVATNGFSQPIPCNTTGSGAVVLNSGASPTFGNGVVLGQPASGDALNISDVQSTALVGAIPCGNMPALTGSVTSTVDTCATAYSPTPPTTTTGATLPILSTYNGTIVDWNNGSSAGYILLPTVNTLGVLPSGFQVAVINTGTVEATVCAVTTPTTATNCATTTSTVASKSTYALAPGAAAIIQSDSISGSGNYKILPMGPNGALTTQTLGTAETTQYTAPGTGTFSAPLMKMIALGFSPVGTSIPSAQGAYATTVPSGCGSNGCYSIGTVGVLADYWDTTQNQHNTGYIAAPSFIPNGTTIPTSQGIYSPASGQLGFGTNSAEAGYVDAAQNLQWSGGDIIVGTGFYTSAPLVIATSNSISAASAMNRPCTNCVGLVSDNAQGLTVDASQNLDVFNAVISKGPAPTLTFPVAGSSACQTSGSTTFATQAGTPQGGTFILSGGPTSGSCTVLVSGLPAVTGTNAGWGCDGTDITDSKAVLQAPGTPGTTSCALIFSPTNASAQITYHLWNWP